MDNKTLRERSINFTPMELNKLRDLLEKYPILTNKKTDCASAKQKDEAWSKLTDEFNSMGDAVYRSKKQLMYKFNNMKKIARKEFNTEKSGRKGTGGGPPPPKPSETSEWIESVMTESIVGREPYLDSEISPLNNETAKQLAEDTEVINATDYLITDLTRGVSGLEPVTTNDMPIIIINDKLDVKEDINTFDVKTIKFDASTPKSMLKKPISKELVSNMCRKRKAPTPLETRKRVFEMTDKKEDLYSERIAREKKISDMAQEEHHMNLEHKEALHNLEIDYKRKTFEMMYKKVQLEYEVEEQKLKNLKMEEELLLKKIKKYE